MYMDACPYTCCLPFFAECPPSLRAAPLRAGAVGWWPHGGRAWVTVRSRRARAGGWPGEWRCRRPLRDAAPEAPDLGYGPPVLCARLVGQGFKAGVWELHVLASPIRPFGAVPIDDYNVSVLGVGVHTDDKPALDLDHNIDGHLRLLLFGSLAQMIIRSGEPGLLLE